MSSHSITVKEMRREKNKFSALLMEIGNYLHEKMNPNDFYSNEETLDFIEHGILEKTKTCYGEVQIGTVDLGLLMGYVTFSLSYIGIIKKSSNPLLKEYWSLGNQSREETFWKFDYLKNKILNNKD